MPSGDSRIGRKPPFATGGFSCRFTDDVDPLPDLEPPGDLAARLSIQAYPASGNQLFRRRPRHAGVLAHDGGQRLPGLTPLDDE